MFVDTITYIDFNGEETTEDFYFHLSASDIARIELSHSGRGKSGMVEELNRIIRKQNGSEIVAAFETFVLDSYGVKSDDGRRFIKTEKVYDEFRWSNAYDVFFIKLVTDAEFGAKFINGLLPEDLQAQAKVLMENQRLQDKKQPSLAVVSPVPETDGLLNAVDFGHVEGTSDGDVQPIGGGNAADKVREILAKKPQQMDKRELMLAMKLKNARGKVLTDKDIDIMDPVTLELMLAAGAKIEGFDE